MDPMYQERISRLKNKKLEQTKEKREKEGPLDEDDYGRIVPPGKPWEITPNHPDGSFYGLDGWVQNFCDLMDNHPTYVDSDDAFAGRWIYCLANKRPNKWNPEYPYDHLKENIKKYDIIHGIGDDAHFAPDYELGLKLGWKGLLEKIAHFKQINNSPEQIKFYEAHEDVIKSIQGWIQRHIDEIKLKAANEEDQAKAQNLSEMAETNENILNEPPKTLREACQWIIWYHLSSRTYNRDGAGGQIDALLQPFYEKDLEDNRIDHDKAVYYLACFLLNDPIYWQLGGPDKHGKDQTSEISFLILEAADKINTSLNITIRVHDGLDQELFRQSVYYLIKNKNGWPRYSGDKALVEGFMKNGFSADVARQRIAVGCNWMSLPGQEYTMNDLVKVNIAKVFEVAFFEMVNDAKTNNSTGILWEKFNKHLKKAVDTAATGMRHHLKYQAFNEPELLLNLLSHGPIEKGLDIVNGGAQYYNLAIDGAGLANVADSFAALEQRIEKEQKLTWDAITYHLVSNYEEEGERIRQLMRNSERFGQGHSLGDKWAHQVKDIFSSLVRNESDPGQRQLFIPGFFSWANTLGFGKSLKATPDGRKKEAPISHGANPNPGFSKDGASSLAMANAIAEVQPGYGNTAPMQWEIDPSLALEENVKLIGDIIKAHFEMGGTLINVNVMDKEKVLEAHKDPSKYPDLVVRVTGFTAYFSMLTPEFRQLVVDRILQD